MKYKTTIYIEYTLMNLFIDSCTGDWYTSRLVVTYIHISIYNHISFIFVFVFIIKAHEYNI